MSAATQIQTQVSDNRADIAGLQVAVGNLAGMHDDVKETRDGLRDITSKLTTLVFLGKLGFGAAVTAAGILAKVWLL